ncbi:MAG: hypothetical protein HC945_04315 [Nitrosarchaeum sp.]|nr:hypothetical protein [Nitrosarchaeum sp.]
MDGIELCLRFSLPPHEKGLCGVQDGSGVLRAYLEGASSADEARMRLERFEGLHPYLSGIARRLGKDWLDPVVVETYWVGSDALGQFTRDDMRWILQRYVRNKTGSDAMAQAAAQKLIEPLPERVAPHHNFHVLYLCAGPHTLAPAVVGEFDQCRVGWGRVRRKLTDAIVVDWTPLVYECGKYVLGGIVERSVRYDAAFLQEPRVGEVVAVHWGMAVLRLDDERLKNLKDATRSTLELVNSIKS